MHVITCTLILPLKDLPKKVDNLERFQSEKQYKVYRCISVKKKCLRIFCQDLLPVHPPHAVL